MNQTGELECITCEASCFGMDVLRLSEVRWKKTGRYTTDDHVLIYNDIAQALSRNTTYPATGKSMMWVYALSNRILIVTIVSKVFDLVIIQVLASRTKSISFTITWM